MTSTSSSWSRAQLRAGAGRSSTSRTAVRCPRTWSFLDGVHSTTELTDATAPSKIYVHLDQRYINEYYDGSLDILRAVSGPGLPPLLVIHGDADVDVPFENGEELFAAAAEPKTWLAIPKANHLLSNSKHMKKALRAIGDHIAAMD